MADDIRLRAAELMEQRAKAAIEVTGSLRWQASGPDIETSRRPGYEVAFAAVEDGQNGAAVAAHIAAADPIWLLAVATELRASVQRHHIETCTCRQPHQWCSCQADLPCPDAAAWITVGETYLRGGGDGRD